MTISGLLSELSAIAPYRASGRVRGCQGSLLVCEGLSSLVGLGETCHVEQPRYNQCEPPRPGEGPLAEVGAIDEARVHLLPFERLEAIGIGARVVVARDRDRIRPTDGWLGRVLDAFGRPLDGGPPLPLGPASYWLRRRRSKRIGGALWARGWIWACAP